MTKALPHRRFVVWLFAMGIATVAQATADATTQEAQANLRASVELVRLNVGVSGPPGQVVPPLTIDDFKVYEDGILQEIELFLRPTDSPLFVALVLDTSESMRPWWISARGAALGFLSQLGRDDCAYVLPFSGELGPGRWRRGLSLDWMEFFEQTTFGNATLLHDALLLSLSQLELTELLPGSAADAAATSGEDTPKKKRAPVAVLDPTTMTRDQLLAVMRILVHEIVHRSPPTLGNCRNSPTSAAQEALSGWEQHRAMVDEIRRAMIVVSDGLDTGSAASLNSLLATVRLASVPVFPVVLGYAQHDPRSRETLSLLANATGGLMMESETPTELHSVYSDVLSYLKSSYVLAYEPGVREGHPDQLVWHDVQVELRRPTLRAIVRPGYYR